MNWKEYRDIIINTPYTEGLQYAPTARWLNMKNIPLGIVSSDGERDKVIRIPAEAVSPYGSTVPVTTIGRLAFSGNAAMTDIIIPPSVNRICAGAFAGCASLERITIPKAVTNIERGTFGGCTALTDIYYEGSAEEWKEVDIVRYKHEVELGDILPGTPVREKTAERYIHMPGNEAVFSANIHFLCVL